MFSTEEGHMRNTMGAKIGAIRSMSKKGDCWDNAVAESFFSTVEHELLGKCTPPNR